MQVEYQRPTDRAPGRDITRRTTPPGNMRSEWHEKSRVRVKGSLADDDDGYESSPPETFYHGSDHEFEPGDIVRSGKEVNKNSFPDQTFPQDAVFLTDDRREAKEYGNHAYEVEPHRPSLRQNGDGFWETQHAKVIRRSGAYEPQGMTDWRQFDTNKYYRRGRQDGFRSDFQDREHLDAKGQKGMPFEPHEIDYLTGHAHGLADGRQHVHDKANEAETLRKLWGEHGMDQETHDLELKYRESAMKKRAIGFPADDAFVTGADTVHPFCEHHEDAAREEALEQHPQISKHVMIGQTCPHCEAMFPEPKKEPSSLERHLVEHHGFHPDDLPSGPRYEHARDEWVDHGHVHSDWKPETVVRQLHLNEHDTHDETHYNEETGKVHSHPTEPHGPAMVHSSALTPAHDWTRLALAAGVSPSDVLTALKSCGMAHEAARAALTYATASWDASAVLADGVPGFLVDVDPQTRIATLTDGREVSVDLIRLATHPEGEGIADPMPDSEPMGGEPADGLGAMQATGTYDGSSFGGGASVYPYRSSTPHAQSANPASTGWATSGDPPNWELQVSAPSNLTTYNSSLKSDGEVTHAGVALKAADTGRVLMIQRSIRDEKDPARGTWEWPGGKLEDGDKTSLHGGIREWEEETGQPFPAGAHMTHVHRNKNYVLHHLVTPSESDVKFGDGRGTPNPDDPDGDDHEQAAWWEINHAKKNPALREEVKKTPWGDLQKAAAIDSDRDKVLDPDWIQGYTHAIDNEPHQLPAHWNDAAGRVRANNYTQGYSEGRAAQGQKWGSRKYDDKGGFIQKCEGPGCRKQISSKKWDEGDHDWITELDNDERHHEFCTEGHALAHMDKNPQMWDHTGVDYDNPTESTIHDIYRRMVGRTAGLSVTAIVERTHIYKEHPDNPDVPSDTPLCGAHQTATPPQRETLSDMVFGPHIPQEPCPDCKSRTKIGGGPYWAQGLYHESTLHEEPEAALPSTDGATEDPDALEVGDDGASAVAPEPLDTSRQAPWGFPESTVNPQAGDQGVDPEYVNSADYGGSPGSGSGGVMSTPSTPVVASVDPILAEFWKTAGGAALRADASGGGSSDKGGGGGEFSDSDIASAAKAVLAKMAAKDFDYAEQRELIEEGLTSNARARNFDEMDLVGTHYALLEDDVSDDEMLWV